MVLLTVLGVPSAATSDSARTFLRTALHLSAADIERLDGGQVVSRTLEVQNRREVATLGIIRVRTSPSIYVERLADITSFKRTPDVLQIGTFGNPPQPRDVAPLNLDEGDLKRLRACRVEDCDLPRAILRNTAALCRPRSHHVNAGHANSRTKRVAKSSVCGCAYSRHAYWSLISS